MDQPNNIEEKSLGRAGLFIEDIYRKLIRD